MNTLVYSTEAKSRQKKPSRISHLCRAAAISQSNKERAEKTKRSCVRWTPAEIKLVIDNYPDYEKLQKILPNRTYNQIKISAQSLGIAKKKTRMDQ